MIMKHLKKLLFQDNTGKYIVAQPPNVLVYVMIIAAIGGHLFTHGKAQTFFDSLFFGAAFAWSYLEIRFGEAGVRRILGVVVMVAIFSSRLI